MSGELPLDADDAVGALIGTVVAGRYRIDALLGVGGMGAVYRAEHVLMRKPVALKVLHREMTAMEEVVRRFEREAIAAGRIEHPNVTLATDFGQLESGAFYLVLEYVPGRDLTHTIEEEGALDEQRALSIARQIAAALEAAHRAGIVHRDLKPDNVLLVERAGTSDFVKVLDFGIAKITVDGSAGTALTRVGAVFGTPAYMAPEQAAGQNVDHRADLYSLGLVLYEMLAGHAAFQSDDVVSLLSKQLTEPPPPLPDSVSQPVRDLVFRLLEKDPALRPESAHDVGLAIEKELVPSREARSLLEIAAPSAPSTGGRRQPSSADAVPVEAKTELITSVPLQVKVAALLARVKRSAPLARGVDWKVLVAGGAATVALVSLTAVLMRRPHPSGVHAEPPPPELTGTIKRAKEGDLAALRELEARLPAERTAAEWLGIGEGRTRGGSYVAAVEAFEHAIRRDPSLVTDAVLLNDVRRAADDDAASSRALDLAAGPLGAGGADVLFDVWASTNEKTEKTTLAKTLLDREDVRKNASPALRFALELRRTTRCDDVKKLLAESGASADERSVRPLEKLKSRSGCGFLGLGDCFPCLRKEDIVTDLWKAAQQRKGPQF